MAERPNPSQIQHSGSGKKEPWRLLHASDPYEDFPLREFPAQIHGWNLESSVFEQVIRLRPRSIVEVGSWKGASAIQMAKLAKAAGIDAVIICVDTWLGGPEAWLKTVDDPTIEMTFNFGRPMLYEQFLANVIHAGQTDTIVPLPVDSQTGATILRNKFAPADAIYIDAAHDYEHVIADLRAWWPMVRAGGVMFGDDYTNAWPGVITAVQQFCAEMRQGLNASFPGKWLIHKTG